MRRVTIVAVLAMACAGRHPAMLPTRVTPAAPVRWNIRVSEQLRHVLDVDEGALLCGRRGERWLVPKPVVDTHEPIDGIAASTLLPAEAVGALLRGDGSILFVTSAGATFRAKEPLGDVTLVTPARAVHVIGVSAKALIAIEKGRLVRSTDEGATWQPTQHPKLADAPYQAALASSGRGLAIGKIQLLLTADHGATWSSQAWPPAALSDVSARDGELFAGNWLLDSDATWKKTKHVSLLRARVLGAPSGWVNTEADRVDLGFAAITDKYVYELESSGETLPYPMSVIRREFGSNRTRTVATETCDKSSIAADGESVEYLCVRGTRGALRRSDDAGNSWFDHGSVSMDRATDPVPWGGFRANAPIDDVRIHLGAKGALLVAGGCPESGPCSTSGAIRVAGSSTFSAVVVNSRYARFGKVRFAGQRAYAVGTVGGAARIGAIFTSTDGGKSFSHYTVRLEGKGYYYANVYLPDRGELVIDDRGDLVRAVVIEGDTRYGVFERSNDRWVALATPDIPSFFGLRGCAGATETNDGGRTWQALGGSFGTRTQCVASGCLVGSDDRVGWGLVGLR